MTLTLTLPRGESVYNGKQVTFVAPCESEGLTGVIVDNVTYDLVSAMGTTLVANSFDAGAMVSVIFDTEKQKAYVQNADTNAYLEGRLARTYVPYTMLASKWSGNSYSFEEEYPHEQYNVEIGVSSEATASQYDSFCEARICGSYNSNVVSAKGDIPTVDIPVILEVAKK